MPPKKKKLTKAQRLKKEKQIVKDVTAPAPSNSPKLTELAIPERNVMMFKDWISGMSHEKIAEKYGMHVTSIHKISLDLKWKSLKKRVVDKMFASAVQEVKAMAYSVSLALKRDMELIVANSIKEKRNLTSDERTHFRAMLDRFLKESRLDEGKPTDISDSKQTRKVEIVLPAGVKRWGIIPPDPRVSFIEKAPDAVTDEINLDDVGDF